MPIFLRAYITLCWAVFVFILISYPMPVVQEYKDTIYDKEAHFILFGVFSFLVYYTLTSIKKIKEYQIILISFFLGLLYSITAEFVQIYVPGRFVSEYDLLAGLFGIIFFVFIAYLKYGKRKK